MIKLIYSEKARKILPIALLVILIIIFFYKVSFLGQDFFFRDVLAHFYPSKALWLKALNGGEFPLWNPYIQLGVPYLADLSNQAMYFLNVLFVLLPSKIALNSFIIIHYIICSIFTYLLCSNLTKNKLIGLISSISFSLCGYCVSLSCNPEYLSTIAWLPAIFWAYYKGLETNKVLFYFLTAIFLSLLIFAGDPFSFYFAIGFISLRALFEVKNRSVFKKQLIISVIIILLSLGISCIQILPAYELSGLSVRAGGLTFNEATIWSLNPLRVIELIFPNYYGYHFNYPQYWGIKLNNAFFTDFDWAEKIYIGLLPFIFGIYSLLNNRNKEKYFWITLVLISLLVSFGYFTPVYKILYNYVPAFSGFRYPEKLILFVSFGLCILSSLGISNFIDSKKEITSKTRQLIILLLIISIGAIFFEFSSLFNLEYLTKSESVSKEFLNNNFNFQIIYLLLLLTSLIISTYLWQINSNNQKKLLVTILVITFLDVFFINQKAFITTSLDFQEKIPSFTSLINKEWDKPYPPRLLNKLNPHSDLSKSYLKSMFKGNSNALYLENFYGYIFKYYFDNLKPNRNLIFGIGSINTTSPLKLKTTDDTIKKYIKTAPIKLIEELGVNYILENKAFTIIYTSKNIVSSLSKDNKHYETLLKVIDPTQRILFSKELPENFKELNKIKNYKITLYSFNKVEIEINLQEDGYITLLDSYYPGWKAYINNKEVNIKNSTNLYRTIKANKGTNKIQFLFDSLAIKVGLLITIISLLAGLICCIYLKIKIPDAS